MAGRSLRLAGRFCTDSRDTCAWRGDSAPDVVHWRRFQRTSVQHRLATRMDAACVVHDRGAKRTQRSARCALDCNLSAPAPSSLGASPPNPPPPAPALVGCGRRRRRRALRGDGGACVVWAEARCAGSDPFRVRFAAATPRCAGLVPFRVKSAAASVRVSFAFQPTCVADLAGVPRPNSGQARTPAMQAVVQEARAPANRARRASLARSFRRSGAIAPMPPSWMPTDAKFANPHSA